MEEEIILINMVDYSETCLIFVRETIKTEMKRYKCMAKVLLTMLLTVWLAGCELMGSYDDSPYKHIFREEEAHLTDDASSPFCDFSIDFSYLNEEGDSIAVLINRAVQGEFLGEDYASLTPEAAVDSFTNVYLRDYKQETGELYQADLARNGAETDVPGWYSKTYSLVSFVEEGRGGMVNVSANWFIDMGGAHPNQFSRWMNFDFETGKLLGVQDVFNASAQADIERILLDKLIREVSDAYPEETIQTLEDLQAKGFLQMTNMYIPHNVLLSKKGVLFLFNRYDIAPYSEGEIVLEVPYEEIGQWMMD